MKNGVSQDVIFKGDLQQWSGLAHALKARYLLHTYGVNKTDALLRQVLSETDAALAAGLSLGHALARFIPTSLLRRLIFFVLYATCIYTIWSVVSKGW